MPGRVAKRLLRLLALGALACASPRLGLAAEIQTVPFVGAAGQQSYQKYLIGGFHRAFAISETGGYGSGYSFPNLDAAIRRALMNCAKRDPNGACKLYGFDGYTVWGTDPHALPRYAAAPPLGAFIPSDYTPVRGPHAAVGLVVWSHGSLPGADETQTQPQGYVSRFLAQGWDVYRYNRLNTGQLQMEIQRMIDSITAARQAGYAKIVLAGQSHGAWISLEALGRGAAVDGVIAAAPARHGSPPSAAARSDFAEVLRRIRERNGADIPVVIAFFQNDSYDPGGRFADAADLLGGTKVPFYLIDRPVDFSGHGSGNSYRFNDRFGACIFKFITTSPYDPGRCVDSLTRSSETTARSSNARH